MDLGWIEGQRWVCKAGAFWRWRQVGREEAIDISWWCLQLDDEDSSKCPGKDKCWNTRVSESRGALLGSLIIGNPSILVFYIRASPIFITSHMVTLVVLKVKRSALGRT